jgi:isoaspartyl peptidase/L-asparaginase-like protein (Ntn-hydrolase superfamily)
MKGAWAAEYNAIVTTRSLTNIDLVNNSRNIGIDGGASSSSSSGANQFSQSSTEGNQDVSLVLDPEDEADAAAEAAGQPESDPEHEIGTRARRLACK